MKAYIMIITTVTTGANNISMNIYMDEEEAIDKFNEYTILFKTSGSNSAVVKLYECTYDYNSNSYDGRLIKGCAQDEPYLSSSVSIDSNGINITSSNTQNNAPLGISNVDMLGIDRSSLISKQVIKDATAWDIGLLSQYSNSDSSYINTPRTSNISHKIEFK